MRLKTAFTIALCIATLLLASAATLGLGTRMAPAQPPAHALRLQYSGLLPGMGQSLWVDTQTWEINYGGGCAVRLQPRDQAEVRASIAALQAIPAFERQSGGDADAIRFTIDYQGRTYTFTDEGLDADGRELRRIAFHLIALAGRYPCTAQG